MPGRRSRAMGRAMGSVAAAMAVLVLVGGGVVAGAPPARAAAGCAVTYSVSSQWQTGFGSSVAVTNLGDPVSQWTLEWSYAAAWR